MLCLPEIHMLKPCTLMCWYLEMGPLKVIRFRWGPEGGISVLIRKREEISTPPLLTLQLDTASQEEGSSQEPSWLAPWSWTSQPPELWEINICSSHPVMAAELRQARWNESISVSNKETFWWLHFVSVPFYLWFAVLSSNFDCHPQWLEEESTD